MTLRSSYLLAMALLLFGVPALGACPATVPSDRVCVQWLPSTTWDDGSPYAAGTVVTYRVHLIDEFGGLTLLATTTATDVTIPGLQPGERCFVVDAVVEGAQPSVTSRPPACKTIRFAGPTDGTIVPAPSDGSIVPQP